MGNTPRIDKLGLIIWGQYISVPPVCQGLRETKRKALALTRAHGSQAGHAPTRVQRLTSVAGMGGLAARNLGSLFADFLWGTQIFKYVMPRSGNSFQHCRRLKTKSRGWTKSCTTLKPCEIIVCWHLQENLQKPGFLGWCEARGFRNHPQSGPSVARPIAQSPTAPGARRASAKTSCGASPRRRRRRRRARRRWRRRLPGQVIGDRCGGFFGGRAPLVLW